MPINTVKCPNCGARVNQVVRIKQALEPLNCPRCKQTFTVSGDDLSERTQEEVRELTAFEKFMSEDDGNFAKVLEDDDGNAVEAALEKADEVFQSARRALDDISLEPTAQAIDANELLDTYAIPEVKNITLDRAKSAVMGKASRGVQRAQERFDFSDEIADDLMGIAERAYDQASGTLEDKVSQKLNSIRHTW